MTPLEKRPIVTAKFVGGRLCLDFANTCTGRTDDGRVIGDRLLEFADLVAWASRAALESGPAAQRMLAEAGRDPEAAIKVWERAVQLRESCYGLFHALIAHQPPSAADLAVVNREWMEALRHRTLVPGTPFLQVQWTGEELDSRLVAGAESAVGLLSSPDSAGRLRECGGVKCHWLFEDTSRNRSRQWCDMKMCGTLAKVRRFRQRQQE